MLISSYSVLAEYYAESLFRSDSTWYETLGSSVLLIEVHEFAVCNAALYIYRHVDRSWTTTNWVPALVVSPFLCQVLQHKCKVRWTSKETTASTSYHCLVEEAVNKCPIAIAMSNEYLASCDRSLSGLRCEVILRNPLQNCYRFQGSASILHIIFKALYKIQNRWTYIIWGTACGHRMAHGKC